MENVGKYKTIYLTIIVEEVNRKINTAKDKDIQYMENRKKHSINENILIKCFYKGKHNKYFSSKTEFVEQKDLNTCQHSKAHL